MALLLVLSSRAFAGEGLLLLVIKHDVGFAEFSGVVRSVSDENVSYRVKADKGFFPNVLKLPEGRYYFSELVSATQRVNKRISPKSYWFEVKAGCFNYAGDWMVYLNASKYQLERGQDLQLKYALSSVDKVRGRNSDSLSNFSLCLSKLRESAVIVEK